ncbi:unnamed protein product [Paramecium sonneborni]|uniref:Uncharacterized protein n=1 Tax=Paramecium sonneborni TaxID=65129 RepID=A0A8S1R2E1_9CILI|nr:unnamed protein product [Paramecium sonneborni]
MIKVQRILLIENFLGAGLRNLKKLKIALCYAQIKKQKRNEKNELRQLTFNNNFIQNIYIEFLSTDLIIDHNSFELENERIML